MKKTVGVIYNSVANVRSEPRHSAELVTQVLLGTPVKILEEEGEWRRVQAPDGYTGWMIGSVHPMSGTELNDWQAHPSLIITALYTPALERPGEKSLPVADLVIGSRIVIESEEKAYWKVRYPDGRVAFVDKSDGIPVNEWLDTVRLTGESIVNCSKQFLGIPYLWGGTSSKGLDCSGFTQLVYFLHGILLSRDASRQVKQGKLVDTSGEFSNALPGDLLFFGSKATGDTREEKLAHVAIYLGDNRFIHASDYVRVNSLDPSDLLYDDFNAHRYLRTKRIIENEAVVGVQETSVDGIFQAGYREGEGIY